VNIGSTMKLLLALFTSFILIIPAGLANENIVRIVSSDWAPYCGKDLLEYGIVAKIITAAYQKNGYNVQFDFKPWKRVLKEVERGEYDGSAVAYHTEERAKIYILSDPYMKSSTVLYQRKNMLKTWNKLEDLKSYRIGILRGSSHSESFDKANFLRKEPVSKHLYNLRKLIANHIDLIAIDPFVAEYLIESKLPLHKGKIEPLNPPLDVSKPLYIMFSRNRPGIQKKIKAFNDGLKKIKNDGTLRNLLSKHAFVE
jgi:polar amino acid transport system substrate-binding protein